MRREDRCRGEEELVRVLRVRAPSWTLKSIEDIRGVYVVIHQTPGIVRRHRRRWLEQRLIEERLHEA